MADGDLELQSLMVELLLDEPHAFEPHAFVQAVQRSLPRTRSIGGDTMVMVAHEDFMHEYAGGKAAPMITSVLEPSRQEMSPMDLSQSWHFPGAADTVRRVRRRWVVTELMGIAHTPRDRVRAFHVSLCAAIEQLRPVAIWSPHCQQLLDPADVVQNPLAAVVNVRLFKVEGDAGAMVMDSLGLHVLRLPDVQCHFRGLEPDGIARVLHNTANYLFEQGDVVQDGNTITGIRGNEHWRCRHEVALIGPQRGVLDVDVGAPYAAGTRGRRPAVLRRLGFRTRSR